MAKKLAPKKGVVPKNNEEVNTHVKVEKSNYGEKETISEKGTEEDTENNPVSSLPKGQAQVGLSKGVTLNLGNYESARISCWISRITNDNEKDIMDNLADISVLLDEQIEFEANELRNEE